MSILRQKTGAPNKSNLCARDVIDFCFHGNRCRRRRQPMTEQEIFKKTETLKSGVCSIRYVIIYKKMEVQFKDSYRL